MKTITKNGTVKTIRRKGALSRLQSQLHSGKKPLKSVTGLQTMQDLDESDLKRINKEVIILKSRL